MEHPWTDPSMRPSKLYRVIHPNSLTVYNPRTGFTAALKSNQECFISSTNLNHFLASIALHRDQKLKPSPYISAFEDLGEAESWAIAAEDVFGQEAYVVEINTEHVALKNATMWYVQDIQDQSGKQLGAGPVKLGGTRNSEWLVLYNVPGVAIRVLKSSTAIRTEREWRDDNLDAAYTGVPLVDENSSLDYTTDIYRDEVEWTMWSKCNCPNHRVCNHAGPFNDPQRV